MKRNALLLTILAALSIEMAMKGAPQTPSVQTTGTIQGIVTRQGTTEAIPDVQITLSGRGYGSTMTARQGQVLVDAAGRGAAIPKETLQQAQEAISNSTRGGRGTPTPSFTAKTDSSGHFSIPNVPVGDTTLRAQLQGYFGTPMNGSYPAFLSISVVVNAQQTTEVNLAMIPGGTVSGRVTDHSGKPLPDLTVEAMQLSYTEGTPTHQPGNLKETDDHGEFRLYRMAPGEYFLVVSPSALPGLRGENQAPSSAEVPITTIYPGVPDWSGAIPIVIKAGEEIAGINLQMLAAVRVKVSGRVTSTLPPGAVTSGRGAVRESIAHVSTAPHSVVSLFDALGSKGASSDAIAADGSFVITNVLPGTYDLIARLPVSYGWGGSNPPERATNSWAFGRTIVEVRNTDIDNANIVVSQGIDVKGRVTVDGKPSSPNLRLSIRPDDIAAEFNDGPTVQVYDQIELYQVRIEQDGSFTFPVIPLGRYRFHAVLGDAVSGQGLTTGARGRGPTEPPHTSLPANAYLADIRQGAVSVYDNGLIIDTQSAIPLEVIMKTDAGSIVGTVFDTNRKPVTAGINVVLVPTESRRQNSALYKTASTDAQGHFTIATAPPGQYRLFAWENVKPGAYQNAEFMRQYENRGISVTVSANSRAAADVGLIQ